LQDLARGKIELTQNRFDLGKRIDILVMNEIQFHDIAAEGADPIFVRPEQRNARRKHSGPRKYARLVPAQAIFPTLPGHVHPNVGAFFFLYYKRGLFLAESLEDDSKQKRPPQDLNHLPPRSLFNAHDSRIAVTAPEIEPEFDLAQSRKRRVRVAHEANFQTIAVDYF
jgi:hypothetical protein